jgi:hypothetical protein
MSAGEIPLIACSVIACAGAKADRRKRLRYRHKGKLMTLRELCGIAPIPISPQALYFRLNQGWSIQRAITEQLESREDSGRRGALKVNPTRGKHYEFKGKTHSAASLAALSPLGLKRQVVNERLRRGWSPKEAIETPLKR